MTRRKFDSVPVPAVVNGAVEEGNIKVEEGAANEIVGAGVVANDISNLTVDELFDKMNKDLREKRKQAKAEGKSEAEVKAIKFDKNSDTYQAWILAFNENQLDLLTKKESKLQVQIEATEKSGKEVSQELFEKWRGANKKIAEVSNAKRARNELSRQSSDSTAEIQRLDRQKALVGEKPALEAQIINLEAKSDVAGVQIEALDNFTVGIGNEDLEDLPAEAIMSFEKKNGTDMIQTFFSKELEKEDKKRINGPKGSLTKKDGFVVSLKEYVGDDGVFATLLLKDANFVKSVRNYFGTEVGVVGKAAETAALQFVHMLKEARIKYDELIIKMRVQERVGTKETGEVEELPPEIPEIPAKISDLQTQIERLKKQSAKTSWLFGGKERKNLENQIKNLEKELAGIAENLAKSATELVQQASANSDVETLQAVADQATDFNKSVQSGSISLGSSQFKKYATVIMAAMAGLTFASSIGEVGSKANKAKPHAGSTIDLGKSGVRSSFESGGMSGMSEARPDAPNGFTEAFDISSIPAVSPLDGGASEPEPEVAGGSTSAGDLLTPAPDTAIPADGTHKLTKLGSKGKGGVRIASVDVGSGGGVKADIAPVSPQPEVVPSPMEKKKSFDNAGYDNLDFSKNWNGDLGRAHDTVDEIQKLAPVANDKQKAAFKKKAAGAIVLCKMFLGEGGHTDTENDEAEIVLRTAQKQHDALSRNLPKETDVESLRSRVQGQVDQLVEQFKMLSGSGRDGAGVIGAEGALEKIQMILMNINTTKKINGKDETVLRGVRANLDRLLSGKNLTGGERSAANQLVQIYDILLQGVPQSDTLWKAPLVGDPTGAQMRALKGEIDKKSAGI